MTFGFAFVGFGSSRKAPGVGSVSERKESDLGRLEAGEELVAHVVSMSEKLVLIYEGGRILIQIVESWYVREDLLQFWIS